MPYQPGESAPRPDSGSSLSRREFVSSVSRGIGAAIVGSTMDVRAGAWQTSGAEENGVSLFNGKDLSGFYTFLRDLGRNNDPKNVFTVRDGVIRISGEIDGVLATNREYENYRVLVEFKWGDVMWPPRLGRAMDSGLLLSCGKMARLVARGQTPSSATSIREQRVTSFCLPAEPR